MMDLSHIKTNRHTFKKFQHLRKAQDFKEVQQRGFRTVVFPFIFYYLPHEGSLEGPRIGIIASRKVGPAVKRNLGKRWARECFRLYPKTQGLEGDIVLILRHSFDQCTYKDFEAFYHRACSKAIRHYSKSI